MSFLFRGFNIVFRSKSGGSPGTLTIVEELEVPRSLRSEVTILAATKAIMLDEDTADFTVRCQTKEFKVHKNFLCSRLVQTNANVPTILSFNCVPLQVSGVASHDPRPDEGGSEDGGGGITEIIQDDHPITRTV